MAVPTLENGPYIFSNNNWFIESTDTGLAARILLEIKNILVALGGDEVNWKVVASSNSVAVINIADVDPDHDLWVDTSDLVTGGGAHSWIIIENQNTGSQLCVDYRDASFYKTYIYFSRSGTYATTGGTISARPTSTDETTILFPPHAFCFSSFYGEHICIHAQESADHRCTRVIIALRDRTDGKTGFVPIFIEQAMDTPSWWTSTDKTLVHYRQYDFVTSWDYDKQSPQLYEFSLNGSFSAYIVTNEPYEAWLATQPLAGVAANYAANSSLPICRASAEISWIDGRSINPIGLYRIDATKGGYFGRVRDLYISSFFYTSPTTYPNDNTHLWAKFGCLLVPWNGEPIKEPF